VPLVRCFPETAARGRAALERSAGTVRRVIVTRSARPVRHRQPALCFLALEKLLECGAGWCFLFDLFDGVPTCEATSGELADRAA